MRPITIIDAGPLVAYLAKRDSHSDWAQATFGKVRPPLVTCEAALTEVCFLLRGTEGVAGVFDLLRRGLVKIDFALSEELEAVRELMLRYREQGVSLADACLVRMSEIFEDCRVMTLDRDFLIYRRLGRKPIPLLAPFV